jgi:poly-gamma-glutamate synthesis protein (capsule biosynthesis protein)
VPSQENISIYAVGDVAVTRDNPESAFSQTLSVLNEPDILFGQLEATLSQKGSPKTESAQRPHPTIGAVLKSAGFDVMSFASNHVLDWGADGLIDTLDIAQENGINWLAPVGKSTKPGSQRLSRENE